MKPELAHRRGCSRPSPDHAEMIRSRWAWRLAGRMARKAEPLTLHGRVKGRAQDRQGGLPPARHLRAREPSPR